MKPVSSAVRHKIKTSVLPWAGAKLRYNKMRSLCKSAHSFEPEIRCSTVLDAIAPCRGQREGLSHGRDHIFRQADSWNRLQALDWFKVCLLRLACLYNAAPLLQRWDSCSHTMFYQSEDPAWLLLMCFCSFYCSPSLGGTALCSAALIHGKCPSAPGVLPAAV